MNTSRRGFLGLMVGGVAVAAAQSFPFRVFSFPTQIVTVGEYADYVNFSEFALSQAMDSVMAEVARKLGMVHGLELDRLSRMAFAS